MESDHHTKAGLRSGRSWRGDTAAARHRLLPLVPEDIFDRQPLLGAGERYVLVGDFRLNDRAALVSTLGIDPNRAATLADSDLVLAAWERWRAEAPRRLSGDFAFAIHDHNERSTYLVTDPVGGRALYHAQTPDGLVAASSLPAMLAMPSVDRELDPRYLARFLVDDPFIGDQTPYKAIRRVPWATIARFGADGPQQSWRYWDLDPERRIRLTRDADYVERARELLDRTILNNARVSGPIVGTLTAGLDSAGIIGTLSKQHPDREIHAITLAPPKDAAIPGGVDTDESPYAARTAAQLPGVRHRVLRISERQARLWEVPEDWFLTSGYPRRNCRALHSQTKCNTVTLRSCDGKALWTARS